MRREVNSGPLSKRSFSGLPRSPIIRLRTLVTRCPGSNRPSGSLGRGRIDHVQDAHDPQVARPSMMKSIAHSLVGPD
jgi:hypothetical protein